MLWLSWHGVGLTAVADGRERLNQRRLMGREGSQDANPRPKSAMGNLSARCSPLRAPLSHVVAQSDQLGDAANLPSISNERLA